MVAPVSEGWGKDPFSQEEKKKYHEALESPECYICGLFNGRGEVAAKRIMDYGQTMVEFFHRSCFEEFTTIKEWKGEKWDPGPVDAPQVEGTNVPI